MIFKQPSRIPEFSKHLNEHLSYHRFDYRAGYSRQYALIDALTSSEYSELEQVIVDNIFLSIAGQLLGWEFHEINSNSNGNMVIYNFQLVKTEKLSQLRQNILRRSFELVDIYTEKVLEVMHKYIWPGRDIDVSVYLDEQELVSVFLINNMQEGIYDHNKLIKEYISRLKESGIAVSYNWGLYLSNELMQIAAIIIPSFDIEEKLSYEEQEKKKQEQFVELVKGKDIKEIITLLQNISKLLGDENWQVEAALRYLFNTLAKENQTLFLQTIEHVTVIHYGFNYNHGSIIFYPVKENLVGLKELYDILNKADYPQKQFWKYMFFDAMAEDDINDFYFLEFINFVHAINSDIGFYGLDRFIKYNQFFLKYKTSHVETHKLPENIIIHISAILLSKTEILNISFDSDICEKCANYFLLNVELLKKIYLYNKNRGNSYDHNGHEMKAISIMSPFFLIEYLKEKTKDIKYLHLRFDQLNLEFIWDIPEYEEIINGALDIIISKAPLYSDMEHQANVLFKRISRTIEQEKMALDYISKFIKKNSDSQQKIAIILNVVTYSFSQYLIKFLREFLLLNKDPGILYILFLHRSHVISGSRVPPIESRITFLKKVIDMVKTLPYPLEYKIHLDHWENEIRHLIEDKEREKKHDFVGWYS